MTNVLYNSGIEPNPLSTSVDTMMIELHDANTPYSTLFSATTVLQQNGQCVVNYPTTVIGNSYYIVLKYKNTVETWSANPVAMASVTSYDFSDDPTKTYGSNVVDVMNENIWSIYSGDINQDLVVDGFDYIMLDPDIIAGQSGYLATDLNGDGTIDAFDYHLLDPNFSNGITIQSP